MKIGSIENLKIAEFVDYGAYLIDKENHKVLLPKKQIPKGINIGDSLDVFIYKDSKDRLISTTKVPYLVAGEVATLTVVDVNNLGAFLNIGLERDLFLPFSEQNKHVKVGDKVQIYMYVDKSDRLCATMYTENKNAIKRIRNKDIRTMEYETLAEKVYKTIKERFKGHLIYTDKTCSSERIKNDFGISKIKFKNSIGKLLKDNKIKITDKGIFLYY